MRNHDLVKGCLESGDNPRSTRLHEVTIKQNNGHENEAHSSNYHLDERSFMLKKKIKINWNKKDDQISYMDD